MRFAHFRLILKIAILALCEHNVISVTRLDSNCNKLILDFTFTISQCVYIGEIIPAYLLYRRYTDRQIQIAKNSYASILTLGCCCVWVSLTVATVQSIEEFPKDLSSVGDVLVQSSELIGRVMPFPSNRPE